MFRIPRKRILYSLLLIILFISLWYLSDRGLLTREIVDQYRSDNPLYSILLFLFLYIISIILLLPTLPLNLYAGFIWGGFLGGILVSFSVTIGGWIAFNISRNLISKTIEEKFSNKYFERLRLKDGFFGWKLVAFSRLNPLIPSAPLNYLLGLTSISNRIFIFTTFFFILPPSIMVAYAGAAMGDLILSADQLTLIYSDLMYLVLFSFIFLLITHLLSRYQKKLQK
jgi:uncharacterized membrane protein YdjX (TVP38/TMEM64 family)